MPGRTPAGGAGMSQPEREISAGIRTSIGEYYPASGLLPNEIEGISEGYGDELKCA
jgi:hypothetical protein